MVPNDTEHLTIRNTSLDILEGIMLNITEMNIAGSIPICKLKDQSVNNTLRWFNWTTTKDENPDSEPDASLDQEVSVPLPMSNKTKL